MTNGVRLAQILLGFTSYVMLHRLCNKGYAFINLMSEETVVAFQAQLNGHKSPCKARGKEQDGGRKPTSVVCCQSALSQQVVSMCPEVTELTSYGILGCVISVISMT